MGTMFGWSSAAAAPASAANRALSEDDANANKRIIFNATVRCSFVSTASYTVPIPPVAISRRSV